MVGGGGCNNVASRFVAINLRERQLCRAIFHFFDRIKHGNIQAAFFYNLFSGKIIPLAGPIFKQKLMYIHWVFY